MIILIAGASHTGKTALAQKLLEKYKYPYFSIDHLKMGLIRSGQTLLTPMSDDGDLTAYLWPIVREMIKTAIENNQNLIVEGCYIPFDWEKDFEKEYRDCIRYYCLILSEKYIRTHFDDIKQYANIIENRMDDDWCTLENVMKDNADVLTQAQKYDVNYILMDDKYEIKPFTVDDIGMSGNQVPIFELFHKQWALVTAGKLEHFNTCTVSWGSMGTLWTRPGKSGEVITVYIHPGRYTQEFLISNDTFTVSFFQEKDRKALGYLGSHSGREEDKVAAAGLTPIAMGNSVTFEEATLTFLCRKVYQHSFEWEDIATDVQEYYKANPKVFPCNENGEWQSHWMFIGEIIDVMEDKK